MKPGSLIIVGGSIAGLFAAVLLKREGWSVRVFEHSRSALHGSGPGLSPRREVGDILREIGRSDVLHRCVVSQEHMFIDRSGDMLGLVATTQEQISWDLLYQAFHAEISEPEYLQARTVVRLSSTAMNAYAHFSDGTTEVADLVIGADGIESIAREYVAPGSRPQFAGYAAFRGLAPESQLPPRSAAMLVGRFTCYDGRRMQVLGSLVPSADGGITPGERRYAWVWYRSMLAEEFDRALMSDAGEHRLSPVPAGSLSVATHAELVQCAQRELPSVLADVIVQEQSPSLEGIFDYQAPALVSKRVLLMGDAAFVVRPHTAMGVAKAAGDAIALREAIKHNDSIHAALLNYEAERLLIGRRIAQYGQRLGKAFSA